MMSAMEDIESERVCQASAISATEPVNSPTQYLMTNRKILVIIEIHPTRSEVMILQKLVKLWSG